MQRTTQLSLAAAAVVVVAVSAITLLPRLTGSSVGGVPTGSPVASTAPSPTLLGTPTPRSTPAATGPAWYPEGSLAPGTYRVSDPGTTLYPYTVTVPEGWKGDNDGLGFHRGDAFFGSGVELTTWIVTHVYRDPCHWTGTLAPVGTAAALASALAAQTVATHSAPVETTIGGRTATMMTLTLDAGFSLAACGQGSRIARLWPDPGPDEGGGWGLTPGETVTVYILDGGGSVMVLMTVVHADSPPADVTALQQLLGSVRFDS